MDNQYKAIETQYQGWRFRSRLEARWAVFFETLGIEYRYESEGFDLGGIKYLPDFYLPKLQTWVEIKPGLPSREEREKLIRLCIARIDDPVALFCGDIGPDNSVFGFAYLGEIMKQFIEHYEKSTNIMNWVTSSECIITRPTGYLHAIADLERGFVWSRCSLLECLICGSININVLGPDTCCKEKKFSKSSPKLLAAYTAARSARFEHGEKP